MIIRDSMKVSGQGLYDISEKIQSIVRGSNIKEGLCTVFLPHTSASLLIQENADPSAQNDLEQWLNRLVPENDALYTHTSEGPDDMPSHIKSTLTAATLSIPIENNKLPLGIWQGIFLWEHRHNACNRNIILHLQSDISAI